MQGGEHTDAHSHDQCDDEGSESDLQRAGDTLQDQVYHRLVIHIGRTEVAVEHIGHVVQILLPLRLVQTQLDLHRRDILGRGLGAQQGLGRIARDGAGQDKREGDYDEQCGDTLHNAL